MKFNIDYVTQYTKHGCNFSGNLAVIDYSQQWKQHRHYGEFGSMAVLDVAEDALKYLSNKHVNDGFTVLLSVPDLVVKFDSKPLPLELANETR